ncbi:MULTISPECIES: electron transfer flavoprotein-ubiquinone oxidoreductase [unclassified Methylophilus]|uniref:electron transfer flavoprotein-ubiquinone oxidoreductase n=1 Tax=unclassified Methylophilus TaxID=2630143 RepID=UPI0006FD377C|nr:MULTISPECIES: electron transfer flavoprotein-ubiquinone oxidoreductase [unclassified Methylophilus]KQT43756.1 electron transfer flavoprotein-ubiquinone oxidoreductase [Methylophilus sp. Leaf416]KQT59241.1 electron transfer flavoprotein-ubiquinone oxidoreductase [Methylophilus sp. Leaf459]
MERDVMEYDVLIVGAGPAGLSAAIRLKQLAQTQGQELSVCILEKGAEVGSHIFSGAVLDPRALQELLPDWQALGAPLNTPVGKDTFVVLGKEKDWALPDWTLPPLMRNHGNYIVSLGEVCRWLATQAEELGVEIYTGFSAQTPSYDDAGRMVGVITGDMGLDKQGNPTGNYTPGIEIRAKYTLVAEGTRGSLTKQLEARYGLRAASSPAKYGLGFKEIWRIKPDLHQKGQIEHTLGWPLDANTGGGGFIYHHGENQVSVGYVVHLDYSNPYLSLFDIFQTYKTHPKLKALLEGGQRISYGARAISEGGIQALPELAFPGGALLGCSAGLVNVPKIKGSHYAMKSGMLAAESVFDAIQQGAPEILTSYPQKLRASWVWQDLTAVRNVKPYLSRWGTWVGTVLGGAEMWLSGFGITLPWTLKHTTADHSTLDEAKNSRQPEYAKPDGVLTFDKLSSVSLCNIGHDDQQPCHLKLTVKDIPERVNLPKYAGPEQRYCPAGVYEFIEQEGTQVLQINAQNCIHCKTCDIKDPTQNITWVPPEGGSGPNYVSQ